MVRGPDNARRVCVSSEDILLSVSFRAEDFEGCLCTVLVNESRACLRAPVRGSTSLGATSPRLARTSSHDTVSRLQQRPCAPASRQSVRVFEGMICHPVVTAELPVSVRHSVRRLGYVHGPVAWQLATTGKVLAPACILFRAVNRRLEVLVLGYVYVDAMCEVM